MRTRLALALAALIALGSNVAGAQGVATGVGPYTIAKQGSFFVGGKYVDVPRGQLMADQAYVEYQIPQPRTHRFPIVMIEGCCSSGEAWEGTPDGRDGWLQYFVAHGWAVYVMDQVGRGRSQYVDSVYGQKNPHSAPSDVRDFISYEKFNLFPQAHLHTQWPGAGTLGDPLFDQFYAAQMPDLRDRVLHTALNRDAIVALLERIGPAILMPHSEAGGYVWPAADARPNLVKAIVAIESGGAVFYDVQLIGPPTWFKDAPTLNHAWGITRVPMTFSPAVTDPAQIAIVEQEQSDAPDLARCWVQKEPARRLPNLRGITILSVVSEASFDTPVEHCTAKFLTQAGVPNTLLRLPDIGIHGNGHFMMMEKNNLQIAAALAAWLHQKGF